MKVLIVSDTHGRLGNLKELSDESLKLPGERGRVYERDDHEGSVRRGATL